MAQTIHVLRALVQSSLGSFQRDMQTVVSNARQAGQAWGEAGRAIGTAVDRATTAVTAMAATGAVAAAKMGGSFLAAQENAEVMLTTLYRDGAVAKKLLADLLDLSKSTPFAFDGIRGAAVQLANAKVPAEQMVSTLTSLGNAVAAVGGGDDDLRGVALAISQMMTSGRLNAGDMLQLVNRGIPAWDLLASKLGKTVAEVRAMSEAGELEGRSSALLLMEAASERFGGAMANMSTKWSGLWSTLVDTVAQKSAVVFEPLFNEGKRTVGDLSAWLESNGSVIDGLRGKVESLVEWWRDHRAEILQNAQAWGQFLAPIGQFLAEHPQLLAALVAIKATGFLGLNDAVVKTSGAMLRSLPIARDLFRTLLGGALPVRAEMMTTGQAIGNAMINARLNVSALTNSMKGLATTANLLKTAGFGAAIAAIVLLAKAVYDLTADTKGMNEQLERSIKLTSQMSEKRSERHQKTLDEADKLFYDPREQQKFLAAKLAEAQLNEQGAAQQARGARNNFNQKDTYLGQVVNDQVRAASEKEMKEAEEKLEELRAYRKELEKRLKIAQETPADTMAQGNQAGAPNGDSVSPSGSRSKDKSVEDLIAESADKRNERELPGFADLRDFLSQPDVTSDQAFRYGSTIEGATQDDAAALAARFSQRGSTGESIESLAAALINSIENRKVATERGEQATEDVSGFSQQIQEQVTAQDLTSTEAARFTQQMQQLAQAFTSGTLTEQQYEQGQRLLENSVRSATQANQEAQQAATQQADAIRDSNSTLSQLRTKLAESFGPSGMQAVQPILSSFGSKMAELQDRVRNGTLSVSDFKNEVAQLANQAERAAQAKQRERLLAGDFAGAGKNLQSAVEDRLLQAREQQWSQYVDQFVNRMYGLGNAMQPVTQQFGSLYGQMQQFGEGLQRQATPENIEAARNALSWAVNSLQGQISTVTNNISLLQQNLQVVDTYQAQARITQMIEEAQAQLEELLEEANAPPVLTESPVDPYSDPALRGGGNTTVNLELPNVNRFSNADINQLADTLVDTLQRRGQVVF